MKKLLLFLLLLPLLANAQKFIVTDSTIIPVKIDEESQLLDSNKTFTCDIKKGNMLAFVAGVDDSNGKLYKVIYKDRLYYVDDYNVSFPYNNDKIDYYDEIKNLNESDAEKLERNANIMGKAYYIKNVRALVSFINSCKKYGIVVCDYTCYDESEYTDGTSVKVIFLNPMHKIIKYIWITFIGYNAVGDPVVSKNGKYRRTLKCVGPISPNESSKYKFNYVWFTDNVKNIKIANIKVQYMDKTIKNITYPSHTIMNGECYNYFFNNPLQTN